MVADDDGSVFFLSLVDGGYYSAGAVVVLLSLDFVSLLAG
jgi:hypothetical protein